MDNIRNKNIKTTRNAQGRTINTVEESTTRTSLGGVRSYSTSSTSTLTHSMPSNQIPKELKDGLQKCI